MQFLDNALAYGVFPFFWKIFPEYQGGCDLQEDPAGGPYLDLHTGGADFLHRRVGLFQQVGGNVGIPQHYFHYAGPLFILTDDDLRNA